MKHEASIEELQADVRPHRFRLQALLAECGIDIDGPNAWDIQVHDDGFYARALADGSLGLGESYMDGWWDVRDLDGFMYRLLTANLDERTRGWREALAWLRATFFNLQRRARSYQVGERHYDLGN